MRFFTLLSIALCLTTGPASAQSLRERAKQQGGSASTIIDADHGVANTHDLMSQSDLVLRGRVVAATPRLRADESAIVTDYLIAPIRVLKQQRVITTARPGEVVQIIVRRPGGKLNEGALHLSTSANAYPEEESFQTGEEVVVFLLYNADAGVYNLTGGPFGAFRVQGGRVQSMTRDVREQRGDQPVDVTAFVDELLRVR